MVSEKSKKSNKFTFFIIAVLAVAVVAFLAYTNIKLKERREKLQNRLDELKEELQDLESKNKELKDSISQAETKEYLEEVARNQFNLKAIGEEVVVITKEGQPSSTNTTEGEAKKWWDVRDWWQQIKNIFK